jgi:glutathione synthase/RimK-type ligase-like ATP-grasp enzyme
MANSGLKQRFYNAICHVLNKCKDLAERMKLIVAGIDLRHTTKGKWYCFEVNHPLHLHIIKKLLIN